MNFDIEELTLDELEVVLEMADSTFKDFEQGNISPKTLKAVAYVFMKRDNPDVSIEEVGKLTIKTLMESVGKEEG